MAYNQDTPGKQSGMRNLLSGEKESLNFSKTTDNLGIFGRNTNRDQSTMRENMPLLTDSTSNDIIGVKFGKNLGSPKRAQSDKKQSFYDKTDVMLKSRSTKRNAVKSPYFVSEDALEEFKEKSKHGYSDALKSIKTLTNKQIEEQELQFVEEIKEIESQLEDEKYTTILYDNLDNIELSNAFFAFLIIMSSVFQHEFNFRLDYYQDDPKFQHRDSLRAAHKTCLAVCSIMTLFFICTTVFRYIIQYQIFKSTKHLMKNDSFWSSKGFYYMIVEIVLAVIHPNLLFDQFKFDTNGPWYLVSVPYNANDYLTLFALFRGLTIFRCIIIYTDFYDVRAYRVHKMFGSDLNVMFALRALYRMYPWRVVFSYAVTVTCLIAYAMRILEGPVWYVREDSRAGLNDYRSFENCVWNTFVTMSTVGYGDYFALTNFGRLVTITCSLLGSILVSITTVTVQNLFALSSEEDKALNQLVRLQDREEINEATARQVKATWDYIRAKNQLLNLMKSGNTDSNQMTLVQTNLKKAVISRIKTNKRVKKLLHKFRNIHELPNEFDSIDNLIQSVESLVEEFNTKIEGGKGNMKLIKKWMENLKHHETFKQTESHESPNTSVSFQGLEGSVKASESFCCNCNCHLYKHK